MEKLLSLGEEKQRFSKVYAMIVSNCSYTINVSILSYLSCWFKWRHLCIFTFKVWDL